VEEVSSSILEVDLPLFFVVAATGDVDLPSFFVVAATGDSYPCFSSGDPPRPSSTGNGTATRYGME
jgi:hypothetical protein